ncbi:MAG: pilin [Planctomycetes bacterium]|jgi:TRAP-type C4-dicarboxylate transport system permease small subunit|nr:pilin [Planctomycetota bacterium]
MKEKYLKKFTILASILVVLPAFLMALPALAQVQPNLGIDYVTPLNLADGDPRTAAVNLVKLLMTFLGIIAVVIILLGGFKWMTAAGNEDKVAEAKKLIAAGIIGLVIILSAFLIVNFVITNVSQSLQA